MDRARRIELYNRCHPEEALEPNDERNLDIDHEGDSAHPPRGFSAIKSILYYPLTRTPDYGILVNSS